MKNTLLAILGLMIVTPWLPAFAGTEGSGGGDLLLLEQTHLEVLVSRRLPEFLWFRVQSLTHETREKLGKSYPSFTRWLLEDSDGFEKQVRSARFSLSDEMSDSLDCAPGASDESWSVACVLSSRWTVRTLLMSALSRLHARSGAAPLEPGVIESLFLDWETGNEQVLHDEAEILAAVKKQVRPQLVFLAGNIESRRLELLPDGLSALKGIFPARTGDFQRDVRESEYRIVRSGKPLVDDEGVERDATTRHDRGAAISIDVHRLALRAPITLGQLTTLLFHEHVRHFGISDDGQAASILVDRRFIGAVRPRSGAPGWCDARKEAVDYVMKALIPSCNESPVDECQWGKSQLDLNAKKQRDEFEVQSREWDTITQALRDGEAPMWSEPEKFRLRFLHLLPARDVTHQNSPGMHLLKQAAWHLSQPIGMLRASRAVSDLYIRSENLSLAEVFCE